MNEHEALEYFYNTFLKDYSCTRPESRLEMDDIGGVVHLHGYADGVESVIEDLKHTIEYRLGYKL